MDDTLLALYRASASLPAADFFDAAMILAQQSIPFDSGGRSRLDVRSGVAVVTDAQLFREDHVMLGEWQSVNGADPVLAQALAHTDSAISYHAATMGPASSEAFGQYVSRNIHHQNGLVMISRTDTPGLLDALAFYRADPAAPFSAAHQQRMQALAPHFHQASQINRRLCGTTDSNFTTAIIRANGVLHYAAPGLVALLREEWPDWNGSGVPAPLLLALRRAGNPTYQGRQLQVLTTARDGLVFLLVVRRSALASLSERELTAARLYGAGMSNKEVARAMAVAPNTARNFIQRVYEKLQVNDKAALALTLAQTATSTAASGSSAPSR